MSDAPVLQVAPTLLNGLEVARCAENQFIRGQTRLKRLIFRGLCLLYGDIGVHDLPPHRQDYVP